MFNRALAACLLECLSQRLSRAVNAADLVAIRVKEIAQVHRTHGTLAYSRRILRGRAAIGDSCIVKFCSCSGELQMKPMVAPLATVAGSPLIGSEMPNVDPSWI